MSIKDIIRSVKTQDALEFKNSVEAELGSRMTNALDNKKIELAQSLFDQDYPDVEEGIAHTVKSIVRGAGAVKDALIADHGGRQLRKDEHKPEHKRMSPERYNKKQAAVQFRDKKVRARIIRQGHEDRKQAAKDAAKK
jgi:hypothetical protein